MLFCEEKIFLVTICGGCQGVVFVFSDDRLLVKHSLCHCYGRCNKHLFSFFMFCVTVSINSRGRI